MYVCVVVMWRFSMLLLNEVPIKLFCALDFDIFPSKLYLNHTYACVAVISITFAAVAAFWLCAIVVCYHWRCSLFPFIRRLASICPCLCVCLVYICDYNVFMRKSAIRTFILFESIQYKWCLSKQNPHKCTRTIIRRSAREIDRKSGRAGKCRELESKNITQTKWKKKYIRRNKKHKSMALVGC